MDGPAEMLRIKRDLGYLTDEQYEEACIQLQAQRSYRAAPPAAPAVQIPPWELPLCNPVARPDGSIPQSAKAAPYNDPALDAIHQYLAERYEPPVAVEPHNAKTDSK